jgi:hypothetical protein
VVDTGTDQVVQEAEVHNLYDGQVVVVVLNILDIRTVADMELLY